MLANSVTINEMEEPNSPTCLEIMTKLHDIMMDFEQTISQSTPRSKTHSIYEDQTPMEIGSTQFIWNRISQCCSYSQQLDNQPCQNHPNEQTMNQLQMWKVPFNNTIIATLYMSPFCLQTLPFMNISLLLTRYLLYIKMFIFLYYLMK